MQQLLHAYQKNKNTKLSPFYSQITSFLKPVADIIWLANPYRNEAENLLPLEELPRTAIQFHEAYKNKLAKQKNTNNTYSHHLEEFLKKHDKINLITQKQHKEFLRQYIDGDISKYLALMIQTKYCQLPALGLKPEEVRSIAQQHYDLLHQDSIYVQQRQTLIDERDINEQFSPFLFDIKATTKRPKKERTPEQLILSLLFSQETYKSIPEVLEQMQATIQAYRDAKNTIADESYSALISFLDLAAKQLQLESKYQEADYDINEDETTLELLAYKMHAFSDAYKTKLEKQRREKEERNKIDQEEQDRKEQQVKAKAKTEEEKMLEEMLKKEKNKQKRASIKQTQPEKIDQNSNNNEPKAKTNPKATFLQTLQEYLLERQDTEPLNEEQHIDVLRKYIGNDITKYLAVMIQATHSLIPWYRNQQRYKLIYAGFIRDLLFTDPLQDPPQVQITPDPGIRQQISKIYKVLRKTTSKEAAPTTKADEILSLIFSKEPIQQHIDSILKKMRAIITDFGKEENTTVDPKYSSLISLLLPAAEQLSLESAYLKKEEANFQTDQRLAKIIEKYDAHLIGPYLVQQLEQLSQLLREFSKTYNKKLAEQKEAERKRKEEEEKERKQKKEKADASIKQTQRLVKQPKRAIDIKEIVQLIQEWIKQKDKTIKEKTAKLTKLEQDIKSLEKQYNKIVKGKKVKRQQT